ncbi:MAG: MaoC/PaaZ C-terminal domain-containing protein [Deltaproteobacteria bacterium]|nr:MaoC/PaaZ C-terminal domain-containing protein [Deltaproteobacteria bacterium]
MESQWSLLKEIKVTDRNHIEALADVPTDSPWFSGHFPGEPILPGIALINIVEQAIIQDALTKEVQVQPYALKRVRFTQPVRPGETLSVSINAEEEEKDILFSFKVVNKENNIVCSGSIIVRKINK